MFKIDQVTAANEAAIDQFAFFAKLSVANAEKLAELGLTSARESVEFATSHAQSLAGARDVQEIFAINSQAVEPAMKRAYALSRSAFEKQGAEFNQVAVAALEEAFKYAPAGSETVIGNVKSAFAAAQSAYDNAVSMNKSFYDNVGKAVEQNVATVKKATTKAAAKAKRAK